MRNDYDIFSGIVTPEELYRVHCCKGRSARVSVAVRLMHSGGSNDAERTDDVAGRGWWWGGGGGSGGGDKIL